MMFHIQSLMICLSILSLAATGLLFLTFPEKRGIHPFLRDQERHRLGWCAAISFVFCLITVSLFLVFGPQR